MQVEGDYTVSNLVFTLPVGYRPSNPSGAFDIKALSAASDFSTYGTATISCDPSGEVSVGAADEDVVMASIRFRV